jgi:hypothetical protein
MCKNWLGATSLKGSVAFDAGVEAKTPEIDVAAAGLRRRYKHPMLQHRV